MTPIVVKLKGKLRQVVSWRWFGLCLLALVTLILHFCTIMQPNEPIFDELHYVTEARSIIAGRGAINLLHPPLAKLFIISGIRLFGDNPFGWRFFSVMFGTISIVLFYFICHKLDMPKNAPFLATVVFAFENLSFVQSSMAMLDVYMVTFMLGSFLFYLQGRSLWSGFSLTLSTLAKLTGILSFFSILIDWIFNRMRRLRLLITLILSSGISFVLLFPALNSALLGSLSNPITAVKNMVTDAASFYTFSSAYQYAASRPWDWLLSPKWIFYCFYPQYLAVISLTVWVVIIPVIAYMVWQAVKGCRPSLFGLAWFAGTYLSVVLLVLLTDRMSFVYYFYPSIGAICIGIGLGLAKLLEWWRKNSQRWLGKTALIIFSGYLTLHLIFFILLSPIATPLVKWLPLGI